MPDMQGYLNGLLSRVKSAAGVMAWPGRVYVLASNDLEAYCTAAGNVYVSVGWLNSAESEDEIAALLAHEFGHVYLDYHQLESASLTADQLAMLTIVGILLARTVTKSNANSAAWGAAETALVSYVLGKRLLVPAWGRQQEENADRFGATVSMRLGYSFTQGFKAFLERQATWEQQNDERRDAERQRALEQVMQAAADQAREKSKVKGDDVISGAMRDIEASLEAGRAGLVQNLSDGVNYLLGRAGDAHPSSTTRLDSLTEQVAPLLAGKPRPRPQVEAWNRVRLQPRTAAILKNYQLVVEAQLALRHGDLARARKFAQQAASGPTAHQALPLLTLSVTEASAAGNTSIALRANMMLDRNLRSEPDRAWATYVMRANGLLGAGQGKQATQVMNEGFGYFVDAPAAWPDAIRFYGLAGDWTRAKQLASVCGARYPAYRGICSSAAMTPSELAEEKRQTEENGKKLMDRLFKR